MLWFFKGNKPEPHDQAFTLCSDKAEVLITFLKQTTSSLGKNSNCIKIQFDKRLLDKPLCVCQSDSHIDMG